MNPNRQDIKHQALPKPINPKGKSPTKAQPAKPAIVGKYIQKVDIQKKKTLMLWLN